LSSRAGQECIFWRRGCIFDALFGEGVVFLTSQAGQVYIFDEGVAFSTSSSANMRQKCEPLARKCVENAYLEAKIGSRGTPWGPVQRTISGEGVAFFALLMVNFCLRGRIFDAISGEGVRFPARSSEPPTKHRWITIDGGVRSGAALTDQKPSPKMRSKMQPLRQKMQPCNPQMRLGLASRTEANAPLSSEGVAFSTLFSMKG